MIIENLESNWKSWIFPSKKSHRMSELMKMLWCTSKSPSRHSMIQAFWPAASLAFTRVFYIPLTTKKCSGISCSNPKIVIDLFCLEIGYIMKIPDLVSMQEFLGNFSDWWLNFKFKHFLSISITKTARKIFFSQQSRFLSNHIKASKTWLR